MAREKDPTGKPVLRWVGGKGALLKELVPRTPRHFKGYFEPFIGGGALFFALRPDYSYIGDVSPEVANVYRVIKNQPTALMQALAGIAIDKQTYYRLRQLERQCGFADLSDIERAARFIYLNKTCFNGLHRVNRQGHFNASWGYRKNPQLFDADNILAVHRALRRVRITASPFDDILRLVRADDFVYLDPPYDPVGPGADFTTYAKGGFSRRDQQRLWQLCVKLHRKGARFMLSNSQTPFIGNLYRAFHTEVISAPRKVGGRGASREPVREVIVRNYR